MPRSLLNRFRPFLLVLAAALAAGALAGCDSNSEEDDADFDILRRGTWRVSSLRVDDTDLTERLRAQYDSPVQFVFFDDEDGNDRDFEIFGRVEGGTNLNVSGDLEIDGSDDELDFFPNSGFSRFRVDYQISQSNRVIFTTEDNEEDGLILRQILLPDSEIGDNFPELRLVITR